MTNLPEPTPIAPTDSLCRRIGDDCREWAEQQPTALDRALGYSAAALAELAMAVKGPINLHIATADDALTAVDYLHPQIELALKLDRQFERYVQVIDRRTVTSAKAPKAKESPNDTDGPTQVNRQGHERPERDGPPSDAARDHK